MRKQQVPEGFVLGIPQNQHDEPSAWVPIHPKLGPIWASITVDPDAERIPKYPLAPIYVYRPIKTNEPWFGQERRRSSLPNWMR